MKKNTMIYKEYTSSVHYDAENSVFYGKVEFIKNSIYYEGINMESLRKAFHDSIDKYLELCIVRNEEPEKPLQGNLNLQIGQLFSVNIDLTL